MFFNFSAFGTVVFSTAIPFPKQYDKVKFFGEFLYLDNVHAQKFILTNEQIIAITNEEIYDNLHTIFLANFENTLESGNMTNYDLPITSWTIKRKKIGDLLFKTIAELPFDPINSIFIDHTVQNQMEYEYAVHPVSNGLEGNPIIGVSMVDFWGWVLTDGVTTFKFDVEIESDSIKTVTDLKKYDNYTKFPAFRFGEREYVEGGLSTMPLQFNENNNEYEITLETLNNLKAFINNKQSKILKNTKGEVWEVITYDFDYKYMDKIKEQPYTVQFKFTQVGEGGA